MADDLGDDWWEDRPGGAARSPGTHSARAPAHTPTPTPAAPSRSQRLSPPPAPGRHPVSPAVGRTAVGAGEHRGGCGARGFLTRETDEWDAHSDLPPPVREEPLPSSGFLLLFS